MKLEKREISLNEYDSLKDALSVEKSLLIEYAFALERLLCKEKRAVALACMQKAGEDLYFVRDLLHDLENA